MRVFLAMFVLAGCSSVPAGIVQGVGYQDEAWTNVRANTRAMVLYYDKELRTAYDSEIDAWFATAVSESRPASDSRPASAVAIAAYQAVRARRTALYADLDVRRDTFLNDPNFAIGKEVAAVMGEYIRQTDEAYGKVRALIDDAKTAVGIGARK